MEKWKVLGGMAIAIFVASDFYFFSVPDTDNDHYLTPANTAAKRIQHPRRSEYQHPISTDTYTDYSCSGKHYCSNVRTYEEAVWVLDNCPNTHMDGDHDGVPCESQFNR